MATFDSLWATGDHAVARKHLLPLTQRARADADTTTLTTCLLRLGRSYALLGEGKDAERFLQEALVLHEARRDSAALCPVVRWLAVSLGQQGRLTESLNHYRRLLDLATAQQDHSHMAWASVGLGWCSSRSGEPKKAIEYFDRAIAWFLELEDCRGELWTRNSLGEALSDLGEYQAALAWHARTVELSDECGTPVIAAIARNNSATIHFALGRPDVALTHYTDAVRFYERAGQKRERVLAALNRGVCLGLLGQYTEAQRIFSAERQFCLEHGLRDQEASATINLAELEGELGHPRAAVAIYRQALGMLDALTVVSRVDLVVGLSDQLASVGELDEGWSVVESELERSTFVANHYRRVQLTYAGARRLLDLGRPAAALQLLETVMAAVAQGDQASVRVDALATAAECHRQLGDLSSARSLLQEATGIWEEERILPLDPRWRELRGASGRRVFTELASMLAAERDGADVSAAFDLLQRYKSRTLLERMLGPGPELADIPGSVTLDRLQSTTLVEGEVLLDFHLGPRASSLFVVSRDQCRRVSLPAASELAPVLRRFHGLLAIPANDGLSGVSAGIHDLLLSSAAPILAEASTVIVSGDGEINLVPLSLLRGEGNEGESGARPGFNTQTWYRVPSATALEWLRNGPSRTAEVVESFLAVASRFDDQGHVLQGALDEVSSLAGTYRNVEAMVTDPQTDREDSIHLDGYDVLHLATHVRVDDRHPWQSEVTLVAGADDNPRAASIAELELSARLAVLSGCGTAAGRLMTGEGVTSLANAFIGAGVPVVVATLWDVDDATTARLVARFYGEMATGLSVAEALRRAQASVRRESATTHPFYWAGFVLIGDGGLQLTLASRPRYSPWVWSGLILLFGGSAWLWRVRLSGRSRH